MKLYKIIEENNIKTKPAIIHIAIINAWLLLLLLGVSGVFGGKTQVILSLLLSTVPSGHSLTQLFGNPSALTKYLYSEFKLHDKQLLLSVVLSSEQVLQIESHFSQEYKLSFK